MHPNSSKLASSHPFSLPLSILLLIVYTPALLPPNPNLAIFEILTKIYTLNQLYYFPSPSTKSEERGYSPCGKLASGERVGVCYRQGKARKGKERNEIDRHVHEKQKKCGSGRIYGE